MLTSLSRNAFLGGWILEKPIINHEDTRLSQCNLRVASCPPWLKLLRCLCAVPVIILAMTLTEQIQKDITDAMRARDELRLSTLRMVKSALKNREIEKMAPLDEKESQQILSTLIKQRKESVEQFSKGGRQELADKETAEIAIIEAYMPKAASEEQIVAGVKAVIAEMGSPTIKEMGAVMKNVMARFSGAGIRVDGKQVSEAVKKELGG